MNKVKLKLYVSGFLLYRGEILESELDSFKARYSGDTYVIEICE